MSSKRKLAYSLLTQKCFCYFKTSHLLGVQQEDVSITAEELVPRLDEFDASILELLPTKLRKQVEARLQLLKSSATPVAVEKRKPNTELQREELLELSGMPDISEQCTCEKCGEKISPFEIPEHMDFHVAQELQAEIRQQPMAVRTVFINSEKQSKRKTKTEPGNNEQQPSKKQKNIMSFFGKKD